MIVVLKMGADKSPHPRIRHRVLLSLNIHPFPWALHLQYIYSVCPEFGWRSPAAGPNHGSR